MILASLVAPNIVRLDGINVFSPDNRVYGYHLVPPERWRREIQKVAVALQARVALSYSREAARDDLPFKANSPAWTAFKALKNWDVRRGHMLGRIAHVVKRVKCFGISAVGEGAPVFITFDDRFVQALAPHAAHYAKRKIPNGMIMQLNPAWLRTAIVPLQIFDMDVQRREYRRWQKRAEVQVPLLQARAKGRNVRKPLTLALTAWSVTAKCAAKLNLLGRI